MRQHDFLGLIPFKDLKMLLLLLQVFCLNVIPVRKTTKKTNTFFPHTNPLISAFFYVRKMLH